MLSINPLLADTSNYSKGRSQDIRYIVIHYTGNKGDTAQANCSYYQGDNRDASAHYFVDETSIWQSVKDADKAWHCGTSGTYYHAGCRNANSIGVEMCSDWDGSEYIITEQTIANAVELVRYLMDKYGVDTDHIVRHYDVTHKVCPRPFVDHPEQWIAFKARLEDDMDEAAVRKIIAQVEAEKATAAPSDTDASQEAREWAESNGILTGYADGTKRYKAPCTREQMVIFLHRLWKLLTSK